MNIANTDPRSPADEARGFHLPPGFEIQLVASEPDIHKPLNIDFDDRGRLWVTETVEYPFPENDGKLKHQDAVKILEDFGPDGKARKITTFADGLNIPIGVLPLSAAKPQDALVYSIPNIYRLRDTDGDGKADERTVLYSKYGYKDTHGMTSNFTWGFDGWVYACHGFSNTPRSRAATVKPSPCSRATSTACGPTARTGVVHVHGQVNPFGLAFDPLGNLYSCDCHTQPIWQLLRGGYYPSFGKPHDGLGFAPTMLDHYGDSTAIAGIAYYAADQFPKEYRDSGFIGDVVTNRVNAFRLTWRGSTPVACQAGLPRQRRPLVPPGGDQARAGRGLVRRRFLQSHHRPLRSAAGPPRPRPRARPHLAHRLLRPRRHAARRRRRCTPTGRPSPSRSLMKDLGNPNLTVRIKATNELVERGGKEGGRRPCRP